MTQALPGSGPAGDLEISYPWKDFLSLAIPPAIPAQIWPCKSSSLGSASRLAVVGTSSPKSSPSQLGTHPVPHLAEIWLCPYKRAETSLCCCCGSSLVSQTETFGSWRCLPKIMLKLWIIFWHGFNTSPSHGKLCGLWVQRSHMIFSCAGSALEGPSGDSSGSATIPWCLWGFAGLLSAGAVPVAQCAVPAQHQPHQSLMASCHKLQHP